MDHPALIGVQNLTKRYGGVVALADMNIEVRRGTIHAVVGENGAGKSTLMKVLAGVVRPDSGTIFVNGETVAIESPSVARRRGIGIVYQELSLFPERSVLANLFVNREPLRGGFVSTRAMEEGSRDMLARLGLNVERLVRCVDQPREGLAAIAAVRRTHLARPDLVLPAAVRADQDRQWACGLRRAWLRLGVRRGRPIGVFGTWMRFSHRYSSVRIRLGHG